MRRSAWVGVSALLGRGGARSLWLMELTMATRKTITKAQAVRYRNGSRAVKSEILDVVCAVTGYHRDYARRALRLALTPRVVKARARRPPKYDSEGVAALAKCWAVARPPARPGQVQAHPEGPLSYQAWVAAEVPDPDADVG